MEEKCASCGEGTITKSMEIQKFLYGLEGVELRAEVEVLTCSSCKEQFTGEQGELARTRAVEKYKQERS